MGQTSVTFTIAANADDADEYNGTMYVTDGSSYLNGYVGFRFQNVSIPQGATIDSAVLEFFSNGNGTTSFSVDVLAEDADNPPTFATSSYNISTRPRTSAQTLWTTGSTTYSVGDSISSPNFAASIQEVIDRSGWSTGNAIVVLTTPNTGNKGIFKYSGSPMYAPRLHITYTTNDALVAHYKLDETSGTTAADSSSYANHGTLIGAPAWSADAVRGGSLEYDYNNGNDYVELPNSPELDDLQLGNYSMATWFKPHSVPPETGATNLSGYGLIKKRNSSLGLHYSHIVGFQFNHYADEGSGGVQQAVTAATYEPGQWHHVVATVDVAAGEVRLYVNGKLRATNSFVPGSPGVDYGTQQWRLGISNPGGSSSERPAHGIQDDVRLFKKVLSQQDVAELYGFVLHLPLNEVSNSYVPDGTLTPDASPAGNDGGYYGACIPSDFRPYPGESGVQFDDPAAIRVPHDDSLVLSDWNTFTLAAWIWPSSGGSSFNIVGKHDQTGRSAYLLRYEPDGRIGVYINEDNVTGGSDEWEGYSATALLGDRPRHVCVTYDGSHVRWYIDGQLDHEEPCTETIGDEGHDVLVGDLNASYNALQGADEVYIYNRVITNAEIAELHGKVAHWKLNEASGNSANDSTLKQRPLTGANSPGWGTGVRQGAAQLSTSARFQSAAAEFSDIEDSVSVACWFKLDQSVAQTTSNLNLVECNTGGDSSSGHILYILGSNKTLRYLIRDGVGHTRAEYDVSHIKAGEWHHVAGVYDGQQLSLYLDGQLVDSTSSTNGMVADLGSLRVGSNVTGQIDDVVIYDRAMQPQEIAEHYGLVGHWKLDETAGITAFDSSGMALHGRYIGGPQLGQTSENDTLGTAVAFNGSSQWVDLPDMQFDFTDGLAVAGWLRPTATPSNYSSIFSISNGTLVDDIWVGWSRGYGMQGWFSDLHDTSGYRRVYDSLEPTLEVWQHCVFSIDSTGNATLYRNGVESGTGYIGIPGATTRIGNYLAYSVYNDAFAGELDDMRFFNRQITATEASSLHGESSPAGVRIIRWVEVR